MMFSKLKSPHSSANDPSLNASVNGAQGILDEILTVTLEDGSTLAFDAPNSIIRTSPDVSFKWAQPSR